MTNEQKAWLAAHPEFQIVGAGGAGQKGEMTQANHRRTGALRADGTFVPRVKAEPPAIKVGVRIMPGEPGGPPLVRG